MGSFRRIKSKSTPLTLTPKNKIKLYMSDRFRADHIRILLSQHCLSLTAPSAACEPRLLRLHLQLLRHCQTFLQSPPPIPCSSTKRTYYDRDDGLTLGPANPGIGKGCMKTKHTGTKKYKWCFQHTLYDVGEKYTIKMSKPQ